ncbi:MAG: hypothetical protein AABX51_04545 [Nanoarchaeota archaeon]
MVDITNIQFLNDPLVLNILLMVTLVIVTFLLLYIVSLKRKMKQNTLACTTDSELKRVLKTTDELLGKLPESEIWSFVSSPDFEIYKEVLKPILNNSPNDAVEKPTPIAIAAPVLDQDIKKDSETLSKIQKNHVPARIEPEKSQKLSAKPPQIESQKPREEKKTEEIPQLKKSSEFKQYGKKSSVKKENKAK